MNPKSISGALLVLAASAAWHAVGAQTPVATIAIEPDSQVIERTASLQLKAATRDAQGAALAGKPVKWASSAPKIASVNPTTGLVTALDRGKATITATSEGKTDSAAIEVVIRYTSIAL